MTGANVSFMYCIVKFLSFSSSVPSCPSRNHGVPKKKPPSADVMATHCPSHDGCLLAIRTTAPTMLGGSACCIATRDSVAASEQDGSASLISLSARAPSGGAGFSFVFSGSSANAAEARHSTSSGRASRFMRRETDGAVGGFHVEGISFAVETKHEQEHQCEPELLQRWRPRAHRGRRQRRLGPRG